MVCILLMPKPHCWVVLDSRLATCAANVKVPDQKPGVMVDHLHSTAKQVSVQSFLLEKLARLEEGTEGSYDPSNLCTLTIL